MNCSFAISSLDVGFEHARTGVTGCGRRATRLVPTVLCPLSAVAGVADMALTLVTTVFSLFTGGTQLEINQHVTDFGRGAETLLSEPYAHLMRSLNPDALRPEQRKDFCDDLVGCPEVLGRLGEKDQAFTNPLSSDSWVKRHVLSRLTYLIRLVCRVIMRTWDLVLGVIALVLSLTRLGRDETLNRFAYDGLRFPGVVTDICRFSILILNPEAKFDEDF